MVTGTVVVLPSDQHPRLRELLLDGDHLIDTGFQAVDITPVDGPDAALATRVCAAIGMAAPHPPLVIVALGSSALLLPAVALAQRAAHRRVAQYVLVDPVLPDATDSWPDARVIVFTDDPGPLPILRGWDASPLAALATWRPDTA